MALTTLALTVLLASSGPEVPPAARRDPAADVANVSGAATVEPGAPAAARAAEPRAPDPWGPLRFLVGSWKSESGGGKPGEAVGGGFTFSIELDGNVAVRRGKAEYAPRAGEAKGVFHEDLTVIQPKGHGFQAWYWDNEGHLIRYAVHSEAGTVVFESEPGQPGPRFRLVYARRGADLVEITFFVAPPGKPFQPYVTGLARRVREGS
jgi:hypothetical protein